MFLSQEILDSKQNKVSCNHFFGVASEWLSIMKRKKNDRREERTRVLVERRLINYETFNGQELWKSLIGNKQTIKRNTYGDASPRDVVISDRGVWAPLRISGSTRPDGYSVESAGGVNGSLRVV